MNRESAADRERGLKVLVQVRELCVDRRFYLTELWAVDFVHRAGDGAKEVTAMARYRWIAWDALDRPIFDSGQFGHSDSGHRRLWSQTLLGRER